MGRGVRLRTKYLTVSAMLAALSVVILMLGSLVDVLDITTAVAASVLCIYAVIEMGGFYPWMIWLTTSILAFLLLPMKTPAIFYAMFAGFYPILKEKLEKLKNPISWILKIVVFHGCLAGMVGLLWLFVPALFVSEGMRWLPMAIYVLSLVCFVVYDIALTKIITLYLIKFRRRFQIK
jgi:hypothetical protein